jgi:hypothetical protein
MSETVAVFCPWVRSDRTPCMIRDGELCYAPDPIDPERQYVGCGAPPEAISHDPGLKLAGVGWR